MSYDDEPLSIGLDTIADFLRRSRRPRMAEFVDDMRGCERRWAAEAERWRRSYQDVLARLHQYEPPAASHAQPNYQPPPEASD